MDQQSHPDSPSIAEDDLSLTTRSPVSLSRRAAARLIDGVVLALAASFVTMLVGLDRPSAFGVEGYLRAAISGVLTATTYLTYFAYFESGGRRTLGKRCLSIDVVSPGGRSITVLQALLRNVWVAYGVAAVVPVIGGLLGGIASLAAVVTIAVGIHGDRVNGRGWHDRWAGGTQVIPR